MYKTNRNPEQETTISWELRSKSLTPNQQPFVRTVLTSCELHYNHQTDFFIATTNNKSVCPQKIYKDCWKTSHGSLCLEVLWSTATWNPRVKVQFWKKVLYLNVTTQIYLFLCSYRAYWIINCLLYTDIYINKYCKFILNYCDMFRC